MLCVYPADCTDFSTNGNGTLDPLSATVTETLNGEYELELVHPIDDAGKWRRLVEGCIIRAPVPSATTPRVNFSAPGDDSGTEAQCYTAMRKAAQAQFDAGCDTPTVTLTVSFINCADTEEYREYGFLQNIFLGDAVRVIAPRVGVWVSMRMTQYTYDCLMEKYTSMTLGTVADTVEGNVISSRQLPSGIITGSKLAINSVGTGQLQSGSVGSVQIKMAAIETAHIQDASITHAKIGEAAIGSAQIQTAAITQAKIGNAAVGTAQIEDASIERAKIKKGSIGSAQIEEGVITSAHIGNGEILSANIQDGAIIHAKIAEAAVGTANIQNAAVDSAQIRDAAITNAKVAGAVIGTANIQDAAIVNAKILDGAITNAKIADLAVDSAKITRPDEMGKRNLHIRHRHRRQSWERVARFQGRRRQICPQVYG